MTTILWNFDTDDWAAGTSKTLQQVEKTYEDFIEMGKNGTFQSSGQITLTHEIDNTTMALALEYLPKIQSAYKHVVDVATCMNITTPYQETQVKFGTFDDYLKGNTQSTTTTTKKATTTGTQSATVAVVTEVVSASASTTNALVANADTSKSSGFQVQPNTLALMIFAAVLVFF